jgi:LPS sulfotransferase NodH
MCAARVDAPRYVLFTTQRSGSTWFCSVIGGQPDAACGVDKNSTDEHHPTSVSEMMIKYSYMKNRVVGGFDNNNITWAKWRQDCETAFMQLARENDGAFAIGFKLMYDQVPPRLMDAFLRYLAEEDIAVVHLEREAVVLQIASSHQSNAREGMHERSAAHAEARRKATPPLNVPFENLASDIRRRMSLNAQWAARLKYSAGVRYYHVAYEQLTGPASESYLRSVLAFVAGDRGAFDLRNVSMASELHQLHEASCCARLAGALYKQVQDAFKGSSLIGACRMLDARETSLEAGSRCLR